MRTTMIIPNKATQKVSGNKAVSAFGSYLKRPMYSNSRSKLRHYRYQIKWTETCFDFVCVGYKSNKSDWSKKTFPTSFDPKEK